MIAVGIDIGSTTTKAVLARDTEFAAHVLTRTGNLPGRTALEVFERLLAENDVGRDAVDVIATTGYGRRLVDIGDLVLTEIKACVAGVLRAGIDPASVGTILDVGGQDTKVIALGDDGEIEDFSMNDKCAAGTGRFLEMLAAKLDLAYEDFVSEASRADMEIHMDSTCAVFAESEAVGLLARNVSKANISAAAHDSIAYRIASMVRRVGRGKDVCFVGGGASNASLVRAIGEHVDARIRVPENHQLLVAYGAALEGRRKRLRRGRTERE
jgi:predicted CoA-substrate-specific enzyme activase